MMDYFELGVICLERRLKGEKVSVTVKALGITNTAYYKALIAVDYDKSKEGKGTMITRFGTYQEKELARIKHSQAHMK